MRLDKIELLKVRISELLNRADVREDTNYTTYLTTIKERLNTMDKEIDSLEISINKSLEKHNIWYAEVLATRQQITQPTQQEPIINNVQPVQKSTVINRAQLIQKSTITSNVQPVQKDVVTNIVPPIQKDAVTNIVPPIQKETVANNVPPIQKEKSSDVSDKLEFKIGTVFVTVMAIVLILIGMSIFGVFAYNTFFNDTMKGILLATVAIAILLVGELVLKRFLPKFSKWITALGCGSLYIALISNYYFLHTIGNVTSIILTIVIACVIILLSKLNNSNIIRSVGLLGAYLCLFPTNTDISLVPLCITMFIILSLHVLNLALPLRIDGKLDLRFSIYSYISSIIFIVIFIFFIEARFMFVGGIIGSGYDIAIAVFIALHIIIYNIVYMLSDKNATYATMTLSSFPILLIAIIPLYSSAPIMLVFTFIALIFLIINFDEEDYYVMYYQFVISGIFLAFTDDYIFKMCVFIVLALTYAIIYTIKEDKISLLPVTVNMMIMSIIYLFNKDFIWQIAFYVTFIICFIIHSTKSKDDAFTISWKYVLLGLSMISTPNLWYHILSRNTLHNPSVISVFLDNIVAANIDLVDYTIPTCVLLIILSLLINNYIPIFKDAHIEYATPYYSIPFILFFLQFVGLSISSMTITAILGIAAIALILNPSFNNPSKLIKYRYLLFSIFITYVCICFNCKFHISNTIAQVIFSTLLIIIAALCVILGFMLKTKNIRIYGLILSLVVCAKLIFIDFIFLPFLGKAAAFVIVGLIALVIAFTYSILEKRLSINTRDTDNTN